MRGCFFKGRPTEAMTELNIKAYGAVDAKDYIPGAEALLVDQTEEGSADEDEKSNCSGDDEGDWVDVSQSEDDWVDVSQSEDDEDDGSDQSADESGSEDVDESGEWEEVSGESEESGDDDQEDDEDSVDSDGKSHVSEGAPAPRPLSKRDKKKQKRIREDLKSMQKKTKAVQLEDKSAVEERKARATAVSLNRILTDKDFAKIDAAQVKKQMDVAKSRKRRSAGDEVIDPSQRWDESRGTIFSEH